MVIWTLDDPSIVTWSLAGLDNGGCTRKGWFWKAVSFCVGINMSFYVYAFVVQSLPSSSLGLDKGLLTTL